MSGGLERDRRPKAAHRLFIKRARARTAEEDDGREVVYAVWVVGNDYTNKTRYYGDLPAQVSRAADGVLSEHDAGRHAARVQRLPAAWALHARRRQPDARADVVGDVYDVPALFRDRPPFGLVIADPPYSDEDAKGIKS